MNRDDLPLMVFQVLVFIAVAAMFGLGGASMYWDHVERMSGICSEPAK